MVKYHCCYSCSTLANNIYLHLSSHPSISVRVYFVFGWHLLRIWFAKKAHFEKPMRIQPKENRNGTRSRYINLLCDTLPPAGASILLAAK